MGFLCFRKFLQKGWFRACYGDYISDPTKGVPVVDVEVVIEEEEDVPKIPNTSKPNISIDVEVKILIC